MKSILTTAGLIALAAVCNAVMDTLDHHLVTSYFATWGDWWAGGIAYSSTDWYWYKPFAHDAWHFFKQVMILCFLFAVAKHKPSIQYLLSKWVWYHWKERYAILITKYKYIVNIAELFIYWGVWAGTHKLFYQGLLV